MNNQTNVNEEIASRGVCEVCENIGNGEKDEYVFCSLECEEKFMRQHKGLYN